MKIAALSKDEVLRALVTGEDGLRESEAARRLREYGRNEIEEERGRPLPVRFLGQLTHFLAVLLWIAAGLSFLSEVLYPGQGMAALGAAIVAVVLINAVFTFVQEYRAEKAMEEMKKLLPFKVKVMRDGGQAEVDARFVVPGDVIMLAEGDRVPADARLIEANSLRVNNAHLTGESEPVARSAAPFDGDFRESPNICFAGTTVTGGDGRAVVFATAMATEFGRIAHLAGTVSPGLSPLQKEIIKVSRIVAALSLAMGAVFFLVGHLIGRSFWENFLFAVGIIVANVPEGLLPTVTLSLAIGSQRMARKKALIKTLTSVETLGSVTVICTDKTGTLTEGKMKVRKVAGFAGEKGFPSLYTVALLCSNAKDVGGELKGDPTETALYRAALEAGELPAGQRLREFPFDPERKRMSTVNELDGKRYVLAKGAPESMFDACAAGGGEEGARAYEALMDEGLRVLAFAFRELPEGEEVSTAEEAEKDLFLLGLAGIEDPPRPEVKGAIRRCREAGIRVIMITGDSSRTALAIGREIGLATGEATVVEGRRLAGMRDAELRDVLSRREVILSRMTPEQKLRVVSVLKDEGERVAVTGDGVNDAPALKRADIGIAMGMAGTDVAREASDMVLLDDNFATIASAVEEGKAVYDNIKKFITYIFSSNIPEIVPYLAYAIFRIPLPLTIIQILAVDLGTDMLPALALGAEKPTPEVMKRPPRSPKERLLSFPVLARAYLFLGPIEAAAGMFGFFYVLYGAGWSWGQSLAPNNPVYLQATTACLTAIVITQAANVFACRSFRESVFSIGLLSNRLVFLGIAVELALILLIDYTGPGNGIFGTRPIPARVWTALVPFALALFAAEEMRKLAVRKIRKT
jgi:sodium/potassium-transporting ATPase subunit alpha